MATQNKSWYKSKTKLGAVLIGAGPILVTLGSMITGDLSWVEGLKFLAPQVGIVLGVFGIRDLPIINSKK